MKNAILIILLALFSVGFAACSDGWVAFDYSDSEAKFKAEQMIKIDDDDDFSDYFECRVWARKRTMGVVLPGTKQEYFEGYIARPDSHDNIYIFLFDLKGNYVNGDYTECKIVDFNDKLIDEFIEADNCLGRFKIDKIQIKTK